MSDPILSTDASDIPDDDVVRLDRRVANQILDVSELDCDFVGLAADGVSANAFMTTTLAAATQQLSGFGYALMAVPLLSLVIVIGSVVTLLGSPTSVTFASPGKSVVLLIFTARSTVLPCKKNKTFLCMVLPLMAASSRTVLGSLPSFAIFAYQS